MQGASPSVDFKAGQRTFIYDVHVMKQCPNPNCMLYTRLEELPDAYMKCPGCDGPLVAVSKPHQSTILSGVPMPAYGQQRTHTELDPTLGNPVQTGFDEYGPVDQVEYAEEYAYGDQDSDGFVDPNRPRGSSIAIKAFVGAMVLLVLVCGLAFIFLGSSIFASARVVSSAQATETALAYVYPAKNTPLTIRPTIQQPTGQQPSGAPPPAAPLPTATQPPAAEQPPPATAPPAPQGPTAPPAQPQPGGGILWAGMSVRFEGGEPVGETSVYKPGDTLHLAVRSAFGEGGVRSVLTRWYGPDNSQIYELRKEYPQAGTYYSGFTLKNNSPWPPGNYRVDVHPNDSVTPAYTVEFSVVP